jgi:hypothetical protein
MSEKKSVVIIGDGWSALGLAGFLARHPSQESKAEQVIWISGSGSRIVSPLPGVEMGFEEKGGVVWSQLANEYALNAGALTEGSFLREFRNKAFREPIWMKAPTPEDRREARNESIWTPERIFAPVFEARMQLSIAEIEALLREKLAEMPNVRRIESVPVQSIQSKSGKLESVTLANGEVIACDRVFFADRWNTIGQIEGMPKGLAFTRKREPMGVLQAVFAHEQPVAMGIQEGFFGTISREAGEETERHIWGYFTQDGMKSFWTICLSSEEGEDNHAIAKKLRKMKNALDKMFVGEGWVPEGKAEFMANVRSEQVRFEESILFSEGEDPREAITLDKLERVYFLTDGYGPTSALRQVDTALKAAGFEITLTAAPSSQESEGAESSESAGGEAETPSPTN